jgi:hypothetical protein
MPTTLFKIPQPLWRLMQFCETYCIAYCCHEEAFNLNAEQVRRWANIVGEEEFTFAQRQLKHLIKKVAYAEGNVECQEFFWLRDKDSLLAWLRQWEEVINDSGYAV